MKVIIDQIQYYNKRRSNPSDGYGIISVGNKKYRVKRIGMGAYSVAYQISNDEVLIDSCCVDISKKIISSTAKIKYFPKITYLGMRKHRCMYIMPYYMPFTKDIDTDVYLDGVELIDNITEAYNNVVRNTLYALGIKPGKESENFYTKYNTEMSIGVINTAKIKDKYRKPIMKCLRRIAKYSTGVYVDFRKENLSFDGKELVLRDVFGISIGE